MFRDHFYGNFLSGFFVDRSVERSEGPLREGLLQLELLLEVPLPAQPGRRASPGLRRALQPPRPPARPEPLVPRQHAGPQLRRELRVHEAPTHRGKAERAITNIDALHPRRMQLAGAEPGQAGTGSER